MNENTEEVEVVESTTEEVEVAETTEERGLAVQKPIMYNMTVDLFDDPANKRKKLCSLDLNDEKNLDMVLNAQQEPDFKIFDCIGKEIKVIGCVATEKDVEFVDEKTGEVIPTKDHTLMLFDEEGKSYVTGSNSCYASFIQFVALKGMPSREHPMTLIPIKTPAKEAGHTYLRLKLKTE